MKNILIGFLSATCFFLFVGATSSNSDNSNDRYEWFDGKLLDKQTGVFWKMSIFKKDMVTGNSYGHYLRYDVVSDNPSIDVVFEGSQEAFDKYVKKHKNSHLAVIDK